MKTHIERAINFYNKAGRWIKWGFPRDYSYTNLYTHIMDGGSIKHNGIVIDNEDSLLVLANEYGLLSE